MPAGPVPDRRWVRGYARGREHLEDALARLDLQLRLAIARQRRERCGNGEDGLRGLYVSEAEIDLLMGGASGARERDEAGSGDVEIPALERELEEAGEALARRAAAALEAGLHLPLAALARHFTLTPFDLDALLLCLALELDPRYERLYAYLHDDLTRKRPSAGLLLEVLCRSRDEQLDRRVHLAPGAPLLRHRLLTRAAEPGGDGGFLARPLAIDERIVGYVLELDGLDEHLAPFTRAIEPGEGPRPAALEPQGESPVAPPKLAPAGAPAGSETGRRFVLWGPAGTGKRAAAGARSGAAGRVLLMVDVAGLLARAGDLREAAERLAREAVLRPADVYLDGAEVLLPEREGGAAGRELLRALEAVPGTVFLGSLSPWPPLPAGEDGAYRRVPFAPPPAEERRELWGRLVEERGLRLAGGTDLELVAERFAFPPAAMRLALAEAAGDAAARSGAVTTDDLLAACRAQQAGGLAALARQVVPLYGWDDIVLPPDRLDQLREVCAHARHRREVFERWGFERKIARGKGLSALFVGPSGAGKTMAAEILARELDLELYKIDLSCVVNKYIGETEKNLGRIFDEAERSQAVLFFDEADALFGKRSQVRDSHDRYANIEINFLLQRMEDHDGTVILASNLRRNIDEAFTRRLRFVIEFPLPGEADRRRIWERLLPDEMPLAGDVDFGFLARRFKLTGGSIKNVVLHAAFLAAAAGGPVTMEHLVRATGRELQKTGKLRVRGDFEQYYDLVREDAP